MKPTQWLDPGTHAVAKDFFETNRKNKDPHFFMFFRLSNRRLESSNGVIRGLKCDDSVSYQTGKGIQRFFLSIRYENVFTDLDQIKNSEIKSDLDDVEMKDNDIP